MALLSEIAKDKSHAVLAVTHDHRTLPYADRIIHIEDGLIVGDERPERVRAAIVTPPPTIPLDEMHSEQVSAAPTRLAKKRKTKFHG
jgi:ABC-type phosphate/phosphonate transport system ATPase subunit